MKLKLVILAAGIGSRYGGLKQLDTFGEGNHALMEYSIFDAKRAGFDSVVCIIRRDFEGAFKEKIGCRIEQLLPVEYAYQDVQDLPEGFVCPPTRTKPRGTGHAFLSAKEFLKDDACVVINADDFYGRESYQVVADFMKNPQNAGQNVLVGYVLAQVLSEFGGVSRGICQVSPDGYLQGIEETKNIQKSESWLITGVLDSWKEVELAPEMLCSMNMMGFVPESLQLGWQYFSEFLNEHLADEKSEFYIPTILERVGKEGVKVAVLSTHAKRFGVTYPEDKPTTSREIDALISAGEYPVNLYNEEGISNNE